ncbi:protein-tyrosine phosphatase-like protein [Lactifluus volemus]|nr:protein-tyrosine phosphatase-like protein [Lactifluus volemus]
MPITDTRNIDSIIDGQLYIGNLSAAKSVDLRRGITHLVSVCPDYPSQGPNHLTIPVQDSEYDDILIHLPIACRFIQTALDNGGRVLVHCHMGISRSATVIAAYSCNYTVSPMDPTYRTWKRRHRQDVTSFLNSLSDTTTIIPEKLSLSSGFPACPEQASCLVAYLGISHCLSLSPSATFPSNTGLKYHHIEIPQSNKAAALLLSLPMICKYIQDAIDNRGRVLVHCLTESTAAIVVCAYLMSSRRVSYKQAYKILQDGISCPCSYLDMR